MGSFLLTLKTGDRFSPKGCDVPSCSGGPFDGSASQFTVMRCGWCANGRALGRWSPGGGPGGRLPFLPPFGRVDGCDRRDAFALNRRRGRAGGCRAKSLDGGFFAAPVRTARGTLWVSVDAGGGTLKLPAGPVLCFGTGWGAVEGVVRRRLGVLPVERNPKVPPLGLKETKKNKQHSLVACWSGGSMRWHPVSRLGSNPPRVRGFWLLAPFEYEKMPGYFCLRRRGHSALSAEVGGLELTLFGGSQLPTGVPGALIFVFAGWFGAGSAKSQPSGPVPGPPGPQVKGTYTQGQGLVPGAKDFTQPAQGVSGAPLFVIDIRVECLTEKRSDVGWGNRKASKPVPTSNGFAVLGQAGGTEGPLPAWGFFMGPLPLGTPPARPPEYRDRGITQGFLLCAGGPRRKGGRSYSDSDIPGADQVADLDGFWV
nr:hypothetical protein Iba_chr09aCG2120 [Ipomoea batatas]